MQSTDILRSSGILKVIRSDGDIEDFDVSRIANSLIREVGIDENLAEKVADSVAIIPNGKIVFASDLRNNAAWVLRSLGYTSAAQCYLKIGVSPYDVAQIITNEHTENANVSENPESISGQISGMTLKEYTLRSVFNREEKIAHSEGYIHVHDLDYFPIRPFCFGNDLRDVLRHGLPPVSNWTHSCVSGPANHAMTAALHAAKWIGCLTTEFSGGLGYDVFNILLAPYARGMTHKEMKQVAQCCVYELSQLFISRKGQSPFSSIMIYPVVPKEWADVEAVVPGGGYDGCYGDYQDETKALFNAFCEVFIEKDYTGKPFNFPKLEVAWKQEWENKGCYEKLHALGMDCGAPYYVNLDVYPAGTKAQCCRMALKGDALVKYCRDPSKLGVENSQRMGSLQTITLNLPMLAASAMRKGSIEEVIEDKFGVAKAILLKKRGMIEKMIRNKRVLRFCSGTCDGRTYLDLDMTHLSIGFVGLNEAVKIITGYELHEDESAVKTGIEMLKWINTLCVEASDANQVLFSTWESPAESCAGRLARLTLKKFRDIPHCGSESPYFTNSDHPRYDAEIPLHRRISITQRLQEHVEGGCMMHLFVGQRIDSLDSYKKLILRTLNQGVKYAAITFDYTTCPHCNLFQKGVLTVCPSCGSTDLELWSRVTGYFSRVYRYNASKYEEWKSRSRY